MAGPLPWDFFPVWSVQAIGLLCFSIFWTLSLLCCIFLCKTLPSQMEPGEPVSFSLHSNQSLSLLHLKFITSMQVCTCVSTYVHACVGGTVYILKQLQVLSRVEMRAQGFFSHLHLHIHLLLHCQYLPLEWYIYYSWSACRHIGDFEPLRRFTSLVFRGWWLFCCCCLFSWMGIGFY